MSIACFIRDDGMYGEMLDMLVRHGFHCIRFTEHAPLMAALASGISNLVLAARDDIDEGSIRSWRTCRTERVLPVIVLSPAMDGTSTIHALDEGADDVVALTMGEAEFAARLKAVLRAYRVGIPRHSISLAGFEFDLATQIAADQGRIVELTPTEFALAWLLFSYPGEFLSRESLLIAVWGSTGNTARRAQEQHIYRLRRKLRLGLERGVQIRVAHGRGYALEMADLSV